MIWLRSALFMGLMVVGIVIYATVIVALWPLTPLTVRQRLAASWGRYNMAALALTCGLRHEVHGLENLPPSPFVILSKHQSAWETLVFHGLFPTFAFVLKQGLMYLPFFGWALKATDQIFIDRSQGVESLRKLQEEGQRYFARGNNVLIFPEGTRVAAGTVGEYKAGGVVMALAAGVPIVPVAHNAGVFWPRRGFLKRPGTIQVRIGAPIATAGLPKSARKQLLNQVREAIEGMMGEMDQGAGKG